MKLATHPKIHPAKRGQYVVARTTKAGTWDYLHSFDPQYGVSFVGILSAETFSTKEDAEKAAEQAWLSCPTSCGPEAVDFKYEIQFIPR